MAFNTCSNPSDLKITDMRFVDIDGAPKRCTILRIDTNQGICGYGEVRDASSKTYALMLKSRILGENPCNVDKIFHKIKQFGGPSRQGGGVSGIEIALWDLAGKAYGVPLYQLLGGKYRDEIRVYCDTDVDGKHTGTDMGHALKKRMEMGFTFLKMDLGIGLLLDEPGTINAPLGFIDDMKKYAPHILNVQGGSVTADMVKQQKTYDIITTAHPFTGIHLTEKGLDYLENYVKEVREVIGYEVPLAIDHFGHVCVEDCIRFARRMEPYNLAWIEDMVPWMYTDQYIRLKNSTCTPVCTGEDIYLKEDFEKLIKQYDRPEAFFYCDPPYYNTEDYYEDVGFTRADHERLANALLSINGFFLLSYNDCPEIRELYSKPGITIEGTTRLSNIAQRY